ncbi:C45 family autoproteolytic acyltransferase/hydolase [Pseudomonas nitroreducens]|uniref:C45 family autoproteolytic acyltransferase/hydolase n=1 Tax=Pseudomonas nitroreducens TaxID=46680 RepID=UPI001FB8561C|nr:C45 family peptidase [Pseudomonas nitroreducens]MCJ1894393.1 C45 family peptidase [Pseudomonas nitroreducens]
MILHTFTTDIRDPLQRGRQIGETFSEQIRQTVALYLDFFPRVGVEIDKARAIGEGSLSALADWCPALAKEVEGLALGAGLPLWQLAALNARTEVLAVMPAQPVEGECSTSVHAPAGAIAPRSLQTWDWHDSLVPHGLLLGFTGSTGLTAKLFTEFGMLGKIGVNSAGLGVHFNILHHESDNGSAGVPVHAIARRVLEEATSVTEAIDMARSARVSASTVLSVFTRNDVRARAASIEMSPAHTVVVVPREDGWLLHTNHFLDGELSWGERTADVSTTYARLEHLKAATTGMTGKALGERADAFCGADGDQAVVCFHPDMSEPDTERWETLLSIGLDTAGCALEYVAGTPKKMADEGFLRF